MGFQKSFLQQLFYSISIIWGISLFYRGNHVLCKVGDGSEYPLKLQPELDNFDIAKYLQNERLVRLQFKCLIFDGPCDIVGRWAKPRAKAALQGTCLMCTKTQEKWLEDFHHILVEKFPDMYKAAVAKYIDNDGVEISEEEKQKIHQAFSDDKVSSVVGDLAKIIPTVTGKAISNADEDETTTNASTSTNSNVTKEES